MSDPMDESSNDPARRQRSGRSWQLRTLALVLLIEALGLAAITVALLVEIAVGASDSLASALALTLVTAIITAGVFAIALGAWRAQPWIRGAATTVQVLLAAVAIGAFQGTFARPDIGWLLLAPAVAGLLLLFSPPVVAVLRRAER